MPVDFNAQVRPALEAWIDTRPSHEGAYLRQLFEQESGYTPHARSGTGAAGLGQITRPTWEDTVAFAMRNIPAEELPGDLDYATLERSDSYDSHVTRPFANAFMTWANLKRLEDFALNGINSKRIRSGDESVAAGTLLDAVGGDPRQWAVIVGAGHKDGMGRMTLFTDDDGNFSTAPAREFYRERRRQFQDGAAEFARRADELRANGDEQGAATAEGRSRRLATSDSTGHVFGFSDRLSTAVAESANLPPLEYEAEELDDFIELRAPGHTNDNPAVQRFVQQREVLQTTQATPPAPEVAAADSRPPPGPLSQLFGSVLETMIPTAAASTAQSEETNLLNLGEQTQPGAVAPTEVRDDLAAVPTQSQEAQPGQAAGAAGAPPPTLLNGTASSATEQAIQEGLRRDGVNRREGQIISEGQADLLEARAQLRDRTINPSGLADEEFNARAGVLDQAVASRAQELQQQGLLAALAGIRTPVDLGSAAQNNANLALLESDGITAGNAGDVLRSFNAQGPTATNLAAADVNRISSLQNDQFTGANRAQGQADVLNRVIGNNPLLAEELLGPGQRVTGFDPTRGIDFNEAAALQSQTNILQRQSPTDAISQANQLTAERLAENRLGELGVVTLRSIQENLRQLSEGTFGSLAAPSNMEGLETLLNFDLANF